MTISWLLLQLSDSSLPTGGFAHSGGLESLVQQQQVVALADLRRFLRDAIWQTGHFALPLVAAAHDDPSSLVRLDQRAEAFLSNHVANRASRTQGRAFLETCARIFPEALHDLRQTAVAAGLRWHHAPIFGAVLNTLGIDRLAAKLFGLDDIRLLYTNDVRFLEQFA